MNVDHIQRKALALSLVTHSFRVVVSGIELVSFYEDLVRQLRHRGVVCAITSGLACVHYGIAETTRDCDLLCHPRSFDDLLKLLGETTLAGTACTYRGNISPPLDARWHEGGWTSHFEWGRSATSAKLDIFGHALRESVPWSRELFGLYAGPQTVAEMKRTNRDKDWPFITALGLRMLEVDDPRGWLHLFAAEPIFELLKTRPCPEGIASSRPALALALKGDSRVAGALNAERMFWEELDRRRIQILEKHLRPYVSAIRKARRNLRASLTEEHEIRVRCASDHLPSNPLKQYGLARYIEESKRALVKSGLIPEMALAWIPDVTIYFEWLNK